MSLFEALKVFPNPSSIQLKPCLAIMYYTKQLDWLTNILQHSLLLFSIHIYNTVIGLSMTISKYFYTLVYNSNDIGFLKN